MGEKVICFGEVLWDDFGETQTIGGAPLNVCYHLSKLDIQPVIVSQVGNDNLGATLLTQMRKWEIDASYCPVSPAYATSTVKVHLGHGGEVNYSITEDVAWDYLEYNEQLAKEISNAAAFVYGTLAARHPVTRGVLFEYVKLAKWPVLDLNLRRPYCDNSVIIPLIRACRTIKLNQDELYFVCQMLNGDISNDRAAINMIFASFDNIYEIILTKGGDGAAYYNRNEYLMASGISIQVRDTVGSGDSFLAAFLHGRLSGNTNQQTLDDAILLSAFIATQNGGCPAYTLTDIDNFKNLKV